MATSINNLQLQQEMLVQQHFNGFDSLQDRPTAEINMSFPYLIELYLQKNKLTITNSELADLARVARYILTEAKTKKIQYPVYTIRYSTFFDYSLVPPFNATIEGRTGKMLYTPLALVAMNYRFVTYLLPNSATFDVYLDSNFAVTNIPINFVVDSQDFSKYLPTSRFNDQRQLLETYFQAGNITIEDVLDYESFMSNQFETPNDDVITYLSNSLEIFESLI